MLFESTTALDSCIYTITIRIIRLRINEVLTGAWVNFLRKFISLVENFYCSEIDPKFCSLGVSHCEDLHLIYRHNSSVNSLSSLDIAFGDEFITRLINFAYSGYRINKILAFDIFTQPYNAIRS